MEKCRCDLVMKERILSEVGKCVEMVFARSSTCVESRPLSLTKSCQLITSIDHALQHGLSNLVRGYWPLISSYCHSETLKTIDRWVGTKGSVRLKSQAWLLSTLVEGSLLSYLQCMTADSQAISRLYSPHAIIRDTSALAQLFSYLRELDSIPFKSDESFESTEDSRSVQTGKDLNGALLKTTLQLTLDGTVPSSAPTMTSSMTSSLASPGDSGFTQIDSETDTASFSEILEGDSASMKEEVAALPEDFPSHKAWGACIASNDCGEFLTASDIANGNASSLVESRINTEVPCNEISYERQKHSKEKGASLKQQKRVSFHECTANPQDEAMDAEGACTLDDSLKHSPPSISHALSSMSSLMDELEGVEIGKDSSTLCVVSLNECDFHGMAGAEDSIVSSTHLSHPNFKLKEVGSIIRTVKTLLSRTTCSERSLTASEERGMPEGQEDPPQSCSQYLGSFQSIDSEVSLGAWDAPRGASSPAVSSCGVKHPINSPRLVPLRRDIASPGVESSYRSSVLNQTPSKACLVNRFLRSITEKKLANCRVAAAISAVNKKKFHSKVVNLYVPGAKPVNELCRELLQELKEEVSCAPFTNPEQIGYQSHIPHETLYSHLLSSPVELVLKVLTVQTSSVDVSGKRDSLYAVVTDEALYICNKKFVKQIYLHLSCISTMLISAGSQWVMIQNLDHSYSLFITPEYGGAAALVSGIELGIRRNRKISTLPAVVHLLYEDFLKFPFAATLLQGEQVHFYSVLHAMEEPCSPSTTPLGPIKKAHLMFRFVTGGAAAAWKPGFFVLKAGVLYLFSNEDEVTSPLIVNMRGVHTSKVGISSRPHSIEVGSLQIAAPDDYVANDWLLCLQRCSSGAYITAACEDKTTFVSCSLLLTEKRMLLLSSLGTLSEAAVNSVEPLLTGFLCDIASLLTADPRGCWCVVEFSCREIRETGGDYILFFNSNHDLHNFKEKLSELNPSVKRMARVVSESEPLRSRCDIIAANMR